MQIIIGHILLSVSKADRGAIHTRDEPPFLKNFSDFLALSRFVAQCDTKRSGKSNACWILWPWDNSFRVCLNSAIEAVNKSTAAHRLCSGPNQSTIQVLAHKCPNNQVTQLICNRLWRAHSPFGAHNNNALYSIIYWQMTPTKGIKQTGLHTC